MEKAYKNQVKLLLDVRPEVAKESSFALHGETAINLFIREEFRQDHPNFIFNIKFV